MPLHRRESQQVTGPSAATRLRGWLIGAMLVLNLVCAQLFAGQNQVSLAQAALVIAPLGVILLVALASRRSVLAAPVVALTQLGLITLLVLVGAALLKQQIYLLYLLQHLAVHAALAWFFLASLRPGQVGACTRFAAQVHAHMSPALIRYTRQITWAWGLFFIANGVVSVGLMITAGPAVWADYAIYATFPLVTLMFVLEYLVRWRVLPREDLSSPWSAVIAYRRHLRQAAEQRARP